MSEFFFCSSLDLIDKDQWNACIDNDHPFLQYEFLNALEKSGSATIKTGWQPHHYIEKDSNEIKNKYKFVNLNEVLLRSNAIIIFHKKFDY